MDRTAELGFFPFGGTYAPVVKATEVSIDKYDGDLGRMKEQGFSAVRGWVAWDRIERKEGQRDFTTLDRLPELGNKHG